MDWGIWAAMTALFESGKDLFGKQSLAQASPLIVAWAWRALALPFLLPLVLFLPFQIGADFWRALLVSGVLNILAAWLYMRALQQSELSLCVPMVALTPLFLLGTSPMIIGEVPNLGAIAGIVLTVVGAFLLGRGEERQGVLEPFKVLWRTRGTRQMLGVAVIWSVSANFDKMGVQNSSPLLWAVAINLTIAIGMLPLLYWAGEGKRARQNPTPWPWIALIATGLSGALTTVCQMTAIGLAGVPHVIAVKRASIMLSVGWGALFFHERVGLRRLAGALLMTTGAVLILIIR